MPSELRASRDTTDRESTTLPVVWEPLRGGEEGARALIAEDRVSRAYRALAGSVTAVTWAWGCVLWRVRVVRTERALFMSSYCGGEMGVKQLCC